VAIQSTTPVSGLSAALDPIEGDQVAVEPGEDQDEDVQTSRSPRGAEGLTLQAQLKRWSKDGNIARYLDDGVLNLIGMRVVEEYEIDVRSRDDWMSKAEKAVKFAIQETQPKTTPWPGASNMIFPLIAQAALEFGARATKAVIPNRNVVKGAIEGSDRGTPMIGPNGQPEMQPLPPGAPPGTPQQPMWKVAPGEKTERAKRVGEYMSWQLLTDIPEWKPQTDQLLHQIPVIGGAAKKTFRDFRLRKNRSLYVSLINLVWNYRAASFEAAPRVTEKVWLYPYEIEELERADLRDIGDGNHEGLFLPYEYGPGDDPTTSETGLGGPESGADSNDMDAPHMFLEQHRRWDLDGDGYSEPYAITVHKRSGKVVRIVARYDEDGIRAKTGKKGERIERIEPIDEYSLIRFLPNIDGGSYPMGFGHLLRPINEAINTCFNQMFDAGTLQNSGAGFIGDQLGVHSGSTALSVGKFIRVNTKGQSIRDSVFPIPFQGPSATLFQLLGILISAGEKMAGIQQILTGDAAIANAPPTTVLALIEQGIQGYTALIGRVFDGIQAEYDKLFKLNRKYLKDKAEYPVGDEWREVTSHDFRLAGGIKPVADYTMTTNMQKLGRAQMLLPLADDPIMNKKEIIRRYLEAGEIDRIDDLFAPGPSPESMIQVQMAMANAQAELGRKRAAEMKDQTQAYLNMAMAKKAAGDASAAWIDQQLQYLQLKIESVNAQTKASKVAFDAYHQHATRQTESAHRNADRTADLVKHFNPQGGGAGSDQDDEDDASGGQAQGGAGSYPVPVVQYAGGPVGGVEAQPGDAGVPALPG
jgi:chaperonin GroES